MKGVILAGGLGTRLYPLTKITNKHLLPVYNRPMIHWPLLLLVEAGINEIMIISGGSYAGAFLQLLGNGRDFGLKDLHYGYQEGEGGIAEALSYAEHFVDRDRVAVVLGDNIFENSVKPIADAFRAQKSGARICLTEVHDPQRFGCPDFDESKRIRRIIEKPKDPPSNYAVTGLYFYDEYVWDVIRTLKPSDRNELEITDVNNAYLRRGDLEYSTLKGWWTDAGTFDSLLSSSALVKEREIRAPFSKFLGAEK